MADTTIARVHYFEQQYLRTQDFVDEQAYHQAMRRRHNIGHHTWGIVQGLELKLEEGSLFVQPGMAIDGYGRELIVPERRPLPLNAFDEKLSDILDVWLLYGKVGSDQPARGYVSCDRNGNRLHYRWQELPQIRLEKPDPAFLIRRKPKSVPEGDLVFGPERTPPDDPEQDWPLFLGQIKRERPDPTEPYTYSINPADRPYIGLWGEQVVDPGGRAKVEIGALSKDDPDRRFAVIIPETTTSDKEPSPSLEIDRNGQVDIRGNTTLYGDLTVKQKAILLPTGSARPAAAPPWRIYHSVEQETILVPVETPESDEEEVTDADTKTLSTQAVVENGSPGTEPPTVEAEIDVHQLRIELPEEAGQYNQVVIGVWSADDKAFKPALTVDGTGKVTVHGDLIIKGQINGPSNPDDLVEKKVRSRAKFSPEAARFLQGGLVSGVSGANLQVQEFYRRLGLITDLSSIRRE